jgi:hypothetical protein
LNLDIRYSWCKLNWQNVQLLLLAPSWITFSIKSWPFETVPWIATNTSPARIFSRIEFYFIHRNICKTRYRIYSYFVYNMSFKYFHDNSNNIVAFFHYIFTLLATTVFFYFSYTYNFYFHP